MYLLLLLLLELSPYTELFATEMEMPEKNEQYVGAEETETKVCDGKNIGFCIG